VIKYPKNVCKYCCLFYLHASGLISHICVNVVELILILVDQVGNLVKYIDELLLLLFNLLKVAVFYQLLGIFSRNAE
jgi:hypothetical protein